MSPQFRCIVNVNGQNQSDLIEASDLDEAFTKCQVSANDLGGTLVGATPYNSELVQAITKMADSADLTSEERAAVNEALGGPSPL